MQQFKLNVVSREKSGRGVARRLRAEGNIPACIYGKGKSRSITVSAVDFRELSREIGDAAALVELVDDQGVTALSLIQDVQRHPIKSRVEHIDFHEVARGETFVAQVPVHVEGEKDSVGVRNEGGMIDHSSHEVEIRCRPSNLPEFVEVNVAELAVGDAIHVRDLPAIEGVEYLDEPDQVIVSCQAPTVAVASTPEEDSVSASEVPASKVKADDGE